jgi:hypothetical protein
MSAPDRRAKLDRDHPDLSVRLVPPEVRARPRIRAHRPPDAVFR